MISPPCDCFILRIFPDVSHYRVTLFQPGELEKELSNYAINLLEVNRQEKYLVVSIGTELHKTTTTKKQKQKNNTKTKQKTKTKNCAITTHPSGQEGVVFVAYLLIIGKFRLDYEYEIEYEYEF